MRKYILILIGLMLVAALTGCGGSSASTATINGTQPVPIAANSIQNQTFSIKRQDGKVLNYVFGNHSGVNWDTDANVTKTGKWQINNGSDLVFTETVLPPAIAATQTFRFIQKEFNDPTHPDYWLVYNPDLTVKTNYRFYVNQVPADFIPTFMGGAVLGGTGFNANVNVTTYSGHLPGAFGFKNTTTAQGPVGFSTFSSASKSAKYNQPKDITYDGKHGLYYVLDNANGAIRSIDSTTGQVLSIACTDATTGTALTFSVPQGITTDGISVFVSDTGNHVIRQFVIDPASSLLKDLNGIPLKGNTKIIAGTLSVAGAIDTANSVTTAAKFNSPAGLTTDGTNLYVADAGNNTIRKIQISSSTGNPVSTLAGAPGVLGTVDGTFTAARFNEPVRLTTDGSKLYVTDFNNRTVRSVQIATGEVITLAGNPAVKAEQVDGTGSAAHFYHPTGITTDGTNLYVTDFNNIVLPRPGVTPTDVNKFSNLIRKIEIATGKVSLLAGGKSYPEDAVVNTIPGDGTERFAKPYGIIWDGASLLVTNGTYSFTTDGVITSNLTSAWNVIFKVSPSP